MTKTKQPANPAPQPKVPGEASQLHDWLLDQAQGGGRTYEPIVILKRIDKATP